MVETGSDTHEESSSNGATDGNELNLSVCKMSLKLIRIVGHETFANFVAVTCDHLSRR